MWALLALKGVPGLLRHILSQSLDQYENILPKCTGWSIWWRMMFVDIKIGVGP